MLSADLRILTEDELEAIAGGARLNPIDVDLGDVAVEVRAVLADTASVTLAAAVDGRDHGQSWRT